MGQANVFPQAFKDSVNSIKYQVCGVFPADWEKAVRLSIDVYLEMGFSYKLESLFFQIWVKFFYYEQFFDSF